MASVSRSQQLHGGDDDHDDHDGHVEENKHSRQTTQAVEEAEAAKAVKAVVSKIDSSRNNCKQGGILNVDMSKNKKKETGVSAKNVKGCYENFTKLNRIVEQRRERQNMEDEEKQTEAIHLSKEKITDVFSGAASVEREEKEKEKEEKQVNPINSGKSGNDDNNGGTNYNAC